MFRLEAIWEKRNRVRILLLAATLVLVLAVVDWWTQSYISLGFLYLFPVMLCAGILPRWAIAALGAVLRLRPIMMTMLVATLGLLPAALSHGIGSDSQRPFAIVIVGGLISDLVMSIFLLPTLYVWIAGNGDVLPAAEGDFE
jgi:hypothetical protein